MNSDVIKGKWKQLTGKIKERWGDLTDDDLQAADGHAEYLVGKLQERYGWSKERAEQSPRRLWMALRRLPSKRTKNSMPFHGP